MERLFDILAVFGIVLIVVVLRSLRRERIRVEHSVSWLLAGVAVLLLSRFQRGLSWLSETLGLGSAAILVAVLVGIVFASVLYRLSRAVSELKDMNITLTQRQAMLEFELRTRNENANPTPKAEPGDSRS